MNIVVHKSFLGLFIIFFMYAPIQPILPETIATTTLLKCGGVAAAAALGGRYVTLATREISQFYQMRFRKIPQAEFYNDFLYGDQAKDNNFKESVVTTESEKSLFTKIKEIVLFRKEQQHQGRPFQANGTNSSSDGNKTCWSQANFHAQQARGFFPKVNNYHYHSDNGDFWKGATVGSFVTGTTCFYLVLKHKKD